MGQSHQDSGISAATPCVCCLIEPAAALKPCSLHLQRTGVIQHTTFSEVYWPWAVDVHSLCGKQRFVSQQLTWDWRAIQHNLVSYNISITTREVPVGFYSCQMMLAPAIQQ